MTEFDNPTQAISTELSDSGTEGDNEGPASCNDLRSHTRKQCKLSAKRAGRDDTSDTDDSESQQSGLGCGQESRGHGGGRPGCGGRGHGCGGRGHGGRARGLGGRGQGQRHTTDGSGSLPANATPINIPDSKHKDSDGYTVDIPWKINRQIQLTM